jgi:hypothetical protein
MFLTCSSLVCRVLMYPIAPPRKRKITRKALFFTSFIIVPRNGRLFADFEVAALGDGGVGGREVRTPPTVRRNPGIAGKNQTRLRRGTWVGFDIMRGVISCPSTRPRGFDIPRISVARVLSFSPNQFWLT